MPPFKRKAGDPPAKERDIKRSKPVSEAKSANTKTQDIKQSRLATNVVAQPTTTKAVEGEVFRRGGAEILTPLERKQIRAKANADALFEDETGEIADDLIDSEGEAIEEDESAEGDSKIRSSKKRRTSTSAGHSKVKVPKAPKFEGLSYKRVVKGLVVLGCVTKISRRDVTLALPNNLTGFVPVASLSAAIRKQLEEQDAESSDEEEAKKHIQRLDISKFVKVGQYLRAAVVSTGEGLKKHIQLSTAPKDVNAGTKAEDLVKNITVQGEVSSIEDHGAILDLGLASGTIRAFVPTLELGGIKLSTLEVGSPMLCKVTSSTSNGKVAKLSAEIKNMGVEYAVKMATDVNTLLPGTVIDFIISEATENGFRGRMMDLVDVTADIFHSGLFFSKDAEASVPKIGKKIKARIIFATLGEGTRHIGVSILPHILTLSQSKSKDIDPTSAATDILPVSTVVDEMKIIKVDGSRGLLLDVGVKGISGFAHISRVSDKRVKDISGDSGKYIEGSLHRGRVIGFNPVDGLFLVSLEAQVLDLPFLSFEDAQPGQIVDGKVSKYKSREGEVRGIILKITDNVSGLVPANHLSDVQLQFPEKKFRMDSTVRARVLSVDPDTRRITLTCKKTLLNSKTNIWSSFSDVRVGTQSLGTIISFLPSGALVEFYGHLKGFLPTSEMSESFIRDPKEHFRIGQVVNLRAIAVKPEDRRLIVSCRQDTEATDSSEQLIERLAPGTIVSGKVSEKLAEEFVLDLENTGVKAILPFTHLADGSEQKCTRAAKHIRVEQNLQDLAVLVVNKNKRLIRLTNRPSLLDALKAGKMPSTFDSLTKGTEVVGFVKNITAIGIFIQFANNLTGLLPKALVKPEAVELPEFGYHKNQTIVSRVQSIDADQQRFFLTQKEIAQDATVVQAKQKPVEEPASISNPVDGVTTVFAVGTSAKARITSVKDTQLNVKLADRVQGRVDVSQVFDSLDQIKDVKHPLKKFQNGQIINVRVLGIHDTRNHRFLPITHQRGNAVFELTTKPSDQHQESLEHLKLTEMRVGDTHLCYVNNVGKDHLWVNVNPNIRGRINVMELTDNAEEISNLTKHYPVGSVLQSRVIQINAAENRLDLSARPVDESRPQVFEDLQLGQQVVGKVSKTIEKLVIVQISENISGAIHICDISDDFSKANPKALQINQIVPAIVSEINKEKKDIWLSTRASKLLATAPEPKDPEINSIREVKVNDIRRGFVKNITEKGLFVSLSRDLTAFVRVSELSDQFIKNWQDKFTLNQLVKGKIVVVKETASQIQMSLKESIISSTYTAPLTFEDIKVGQIHHGKVRKVEEFGVFVVLDKSVNISGLCHKTQLADGPVSSVKELYDEGDAVKVKILKVDKDSKRINLGMKASYFMDDDDESELDSESERTLQDIPSEDGDMLSDEEGGVTTEENSQKPEKDTDSKVKSSSKAMESLDLAGFDWTGAPAQNDGDHEMLDAETEPAPIKKRKHAAAIQIDHTGDLDSHGAQSVSDFERLLMGQPNSSYLWLSYMAFHLQLSEVDKARHIAERALQTINSESRASQEEALNVWIGFLNLENSYGEDESVEEIFKRACIQNDPQEVYTRLTSIYIQSGKQDKATTLFEEMIKKFSSDPKIWQNYASFLFDVAEDPAKARSLLPRAMQALPSIAHIDIATKFAQLEFKSTQGDNERGRTIFEGLITTFPKRLDLWNVLIDLEIKAGSKDQVRQLFDRVVAGKIKAQKAKHFFKKWLEYEEKEGDAKSQEKVKIRAAEFVRQAEEAKV